MILFIIIIINCLIGCVTCYFKFNEITLATLICSCVCGFIFPLFVIFECIFDFLDKLDDIKIIRK